MQWALDHWEIAAPRCVALIDEYLAAPERPRATADALLPIVHLLGEKAETAAFAPLCRLLHDADATEAVLGDAITTSLKQILISIYDGNFAALASVIEATEAEEFARGACLEVLAYLTQAGRIPLDDTSAYLRHLLEAMRPQAQHWVWYSWQQCVALLGLEEFSADVRRLFSRGFINRSVMGFHDFHKHLRTALADPASMERFAQEDLAPMGGAIDALSGWYYYSEQYKIDEQKRRERVVREAARPARGVPSAYTPGPRDGFSESNPFRHVGRNDPCPCGSGSKFKKCCLGDTAKLERLAEAIG